MKTIEDIKKIAVFILDEEECICEEPGQNDHCVFCLATDLPQLDKLYIIIELYGGIVNDVCHATFIEEEHDKEFTRLIRDLIHTEEDLKQDMLMEEYREWLSNVGDQEEYVQEVIKL